MNEQDVNKPEEIDLEEYVGLHVLPTDPNISVVAGSEPTKPHHRAPEYAPPRGVAVKAETEAEAETVVDQVARFIERFVFLKTKSLYNLIALWVVATHMHRDFEYMGYIFACSPEPQSGKSRLLEVLELLVAQPSGTLVSPSEAVLFRTSEGQTQLLDEVDGWTNRDELKNILKAGFHIGGKVPRMIDHGGTYEVEYFQVYAPRALAGIGNRILDDATRDRTFVIDMVRQTHEERREQLRLRRIGTEAEAIKTEIQDWAKANQKEVVAVYDSSDFSYLDSFRDRTIDVTQPLAAIVEVCYKDHPGLESVRTSLLEAVALTRKDQQPLTDDHRILRILAELARNTNPLIGNGTELAEMCAPLLGEKPENLPVSAVLRKYGFEPKSSRKDGGEPKYRYSLPLTALEEILKRYGSPKEAGDQGPDKAVVTVVVQGIEEGHGA